MTRLSDIPLGESITLCLYGGAGTGKTWMCGTLGDRTLYCNIENRLATFQGVLFKQRYKFNPLVITVHEEPVPDGGAKALVKLTQEINREIDEHKDEFDNICIDGATALRRFAMNMGLEINQKTKKSQSLTNKATISPDFPVTDITVQDYGMEMALIERFIIQMKEYCFEAKKNFILTAHERVEFNKPARIGDAPTVRSVKPGFTGQTFPDSIPGLFDLVWHTEVVGGGSGATYVVRTEGDRELIAKTCFNGLFKDRIPSPILTDVFKRIKEGK